MDKGLESLDDPAVCAGDLGRGPMWMRGHLSPQRMITSWTAQENDRKNNTESTDQLDYINPATSQ